MYFEFSEKELIYLLNSLTITIRFLKWHNLEERKLLEQYFNFEDYNNEYFLIDLLYKRLSLAGNKYFYNVKDDIYFIGQKNFLISDKKIFRKKKNIFSKIVDKLKKVV